MGPESPQFSLRKDIHSAQQGDTEAQRCDVTLIGSPTVALHPVAVNLASLASPCDCTDAVEGKSCQLSYSSQQGQHIRMP